MDTQNIGLEDIKRSFDPFNMRNTHRIFSTFNTELIRPPTVTSLTNVTYLKEAHIPPFFMKD